MKKIYSMLMYLLLPAILLRLLWKSRRLPAYRHRISERLALKKLAKADIWIHAVSMGEVTAVSPLVERLINQNFRILFTTMTPTGSQQVLTRFESKLAHQYIPYDLPGCFNRFFKQVQPKIGIIMETELWPNMLFAADKAGVKTLLANGRISDKAYLKYHPFRWFFAPLLAKFTLIGTQSDLDSQRFQSLGAPSSKIAMLGNMKFDGSYPKSEQNNLQWLKLAWGLERPVWIAASTHEQEEQQLMAQLPRIKQAIPGILLVIAPRHPERFLKVYTLAQHLGWNTGLRSKTQTIQPNNDVVVLDSMGELVQCYLLSDYVFVGGTLVPVGGHNVLEPIAIQKPVVCGPHMQNSQSIFDELLQHEALQIGMSSDEVANKIISFYHDSAKRDGQIKRASAVLNNHSGSVERYFHQIVQILQG